jgi:hypothetical protein
LGVSFSLRSARLRVEHIEAGFKGVRLVGGKHRTGEKRCDLGAGLAETIGVDDGRYDAHAAECRTGAHVAAAPAVVATPSVAATDSGTATAHANDGHVAALSFVGAQCVSDYGRRLGRRLAGDLNVSYATAAARERGKRQTN